MNVIVIVNELVMGEDAIVKDDFAVNYALDDDLKKSREKRGETKFYWLIYIFEWILQLWLKKFFLI